MTNIELPNSAYNKEKSMLVKATNLNRARFNPHVLAALAIALGYHGVLLFSTFRRTYDAFVHIFFADHYSRAWFDPWDYRWYTGFTLTSYPPGSQQSIALLSRFFGLEGGFIIVQMFAIMMVVIGIYRFSKIWVSEEAAGYAALLTVFSSSITETIHVFGQLPTTFSLGFLLNALAYANAWLKTGDWKMLLAAWALNAATTAGHHVTTLFGAVFFLGPVIVLNIVEKLRQELSDEPLQRPATVTRQNIRPLLMRRLRRIVPVSLRVGLYGMGLGIILIGVVLPYWLWSKDDPISQVPIPHSSRDSFIANPNAGLVFWLIPYGVALFVLPYVVYKGLTTKAWPMMMSFLLLFLLGTGGTTPIPKMLLRGSFDVLTLDRFTFWATILMLPLLGELVVSLRHRGLAKYINEQFGSSTRLILSGMMMVAYILFSVFTANLTYFRTFQPAAIDPQPIVNFLDKDQHWKWRYLALGFGDQMAWISAQTTATTVDGNYHSARRLPELTTTPVERLEGAKFRGIPGIGSLQQFLAVPSKYNLKFVFSNDQFYDPLLYFSGWHRVQRLDNGIMVWEHEDIPPLPEVLPRKDIPMWQRLMWGLLPMGAISMALLTMSSFIWAPRLIRLLRFIGFIGAVKFVTKRFHLPNPAGSLWNAVDGRLRRWSELPATDDSPVVPWQIWINWLMKLPRPKPASPTAQQVRSAILYILMAIALVIGINRLISQQSAPIAVIQAYYDDLDFRRFSAAYQRLDPQTRPSYDQYMLQLSVNGGLLASYAKLDTITAEIIHAEPDRVTLQTKTLWVTSLNEYLTSREHTLVKENDRWYVLPDSANLTTAPDSFLRQSVISWLSQGRRRVTTGPTEFVDIMDRPDIQVLSSRLVRQGDRYFLVGEIMNVSSDPADVTVSGLLYDSENTLLTRYDAQKGTIHKVLPQERVPFRVDFEGVAGLALEDAATAGDFSPDAFSALKLNAQVASYQIFARGVVTSHDLFRDLTIQDVEVVIGVDGNAHITGTLLNNGTVEATIPHMLATYYDADGNVLWVDDAFVEAAVRPQLSQRFDVPVTSFSLLEPLLQNPLTTTFGQQTGDEIDLPPNLGFASLRLSVHYFTGAVG
jgi:hypothetical protein